MARVVLVTGVSRYLGGRFARTLQADPGIERVIGVDVVPPSEDLGRAEFVRADIRNPVIARVIDRAEVDTVVHMNVIATPVGTGGRVAMKEINVIGTMQLLAACQKAPSLAKLVVKSSTVVYGSSACDPAMFTEETEPRQIPRSGFAKDSVEVEGYVRGFARRRPDVAVSQLRLANVIGPGMQTPLTAYFSLPVIPTVLGFDARLQLLHEDDAIGAIHRVTVEDRPGTCNVAGDGVLMLSQAVRKLGKAALPLPAAVSARAGQAVRRAGFADFSAEQMRFLAHGRVVDTTRMRAELGYEPRHTTVTAFEDFARARGLVRLPPQKVAAAGRRLASTLSCGRIGDA
jgi:UDP-glucose 4-epimerase